MNCLYYKDKLINFNNHGSMYENQLSVFALKNSVHIVQKYQYFVVPNTKSSQAPP